ncbi:MAG: type II toxin-antitoxin system RelE/ParE family toxin [Balneolaceae bacterium]
MTSKKTKIKWTPFALNSLKNIHDYITYKEKSEEPANKVIQEIFDRVRQLTEFPESGQIEPLLHDIGQNSRFIIQYNYKIIYEYDSDNFLIIITDVFHTSQDPSNLTKEKNE